MLIKKKKHLAEKSALHIRNKHRNRYDFKELITSYPALAPFVRLNAYHDPSIDFFNPEAVKMLNKALLKHYYDVAHWDIPPHYLCPPIPGRADYLHHMAELLSDDNNGHIPMGHKITCLDIGVGANCVYPIIGIKEYGWSFIGADIDTIALASARKIMAANPNLKDKIDLRLQGDPNHIFRGIIQQDEFIHLTICNPPFHASLAEAKDATLRKLQNLTGQHHHKPILNFGGQQNELWCPGGEKTFIKNMIRESKLFATSCHWFSSLVSKQESLSSIYDTLKKENVADVKTIPMGQGNKISRIVAWTYVGKSKQAPI